MTATAALAPAEDESPALPLAELTAIADELAGPRSAIETTFLEMGQRLMTGAKLLREMSAAHEGMPGQFQGQEFLRAVEMMQALRDEVAGMAEGRKEDDSHVAQLAKMADDLYGPLDSLKKAVKGLSLIAVNARIVAAGIDTGNGDFAAFTLDMIELGQNARETVAGVSDAHGKVAQTLAKSREANKAFAERHVGTTGAIVTRLGGQLETVELHRQRAVGDAAESSKLTKMIGGRIGEAVSALQIGDITRQRLEHIEDALRSAADGPAGDAGGDDTVLTLCRLQALQLGDTRDDFERQVTTFAAALRHLADDTALVLGDSKGQAEALLAGSGTALAALVEDLKATASLLEEYEAVQTELCRLAREVEASMHSMLEQLEAVGEIEQSIRLLSLNTAIRCSRLGEEGRALKVIAEEMRGFAAHTVEAAGTVGHFLDGTREMMNARSRAAAAEGAALKGDAAVVIDLLEGVLLRLRQNVSTIAEAGPSTVELLNKAAANAAIYEKGEVSWPALIERLETLAMPEGPNPEERPVDVDFFAGLRRKYTMESERRIHDQVCGACEEAAPPGEDETDAMLF